MVISPDSPKKKTLSDLPESYTDVQPVAVEVKKDCYVPKWCKSVNPSSDLIGEGKRSEYQWLDKVKELLEKDKLDKEDYIFVSAHFASLQSQAARSQAITALLPLFDENAHTMAMIQHSMKIVKEGVASVNPNQTPVIAMEQPLFAIAKQIHWEKTDLYGEEKICCHDGWPACLNGLVEYVCALVGQKAGGTVHWYKLILRQEEERMVF